MAGEVIVFTPLHELETVTAMQLKVVRGEARPEQALAATALVSEDLAAGKLAGVVQDWPAAFREASLLAQAHAAKIGCRSQDILHCALAKTLQATLFISSDARQIALARAETMRVLAI